MHDINILDQQTRREALNPERSFIVQAPAGSGKTELLTQRYLQLLGRAEKAPEEIIAITFTRKAASEMRERVLRALEKATTLPIPEEPHAQLTWRLAKQVIQRDQQQQWHLLVNPNRLRILTIDALCAEIAAQMPLLAGFGANPKITENATPYYQQAVIELFKQLNNDTPWRSAFTTLLLHLDNQIGMVENLLIDILGRREQWLPHVIGLRQQQNKISLETGLQNIVSEKISALYIYFTQKLPPPLINELIKLAQFAGNYLHSIDPTHPIAQCKTLDSLPQPILAHIPYWLGLADLLLTKEGEWRRRIDKNSGFPAAKEIIAYDSSAKNYKQQMQELIQQLSTHETLRNRLAALSSCPPIHYTTDQWQIIEALLELLPNLVAELHVLFQRDGVIDFVELGLAALQALGDDEKPTDLALYLDYQIKHILVDEFQDTSLTQFCLIERLLNGWEVGDGRTIFLVGDPMQSIYRFRNADVGIFLRAKQQGIGQITLHSLTLLQNFRSKPGIIQWINQIFAKILPQSSDITLGAVPYTPVYATQQQETNSALLTGKEPDCFANVLNDKDKQEQEQEQEIHYYTDLTYETQSIVTLIQTYQQIYPDDSIAILVRSRTHLADIIPALHQAQLTFQAMDIEPLIEREEIIDLFSLTRALYHLADKMAWLAILRAPWCGLTLTDLLIIASTPMTIWDTLQNWESLSALSEDAKQRLQRIVPVLTHAMHARGRSSSISEWIEGTWLALGGPAVLQESENFANVKAYFKLVDKMEKANPLFTITDLNLQLQKLYAEPNTQGNANLQIMTIHKAKGLEFDHVILPKLERKIPHDSARLLLWLERPNLLGSSDLILAPIKPRSSVQDRIYDYLRCVENAKQDFEKVRLLYVATTRAKKSLHLMATVKSQEIQEIEEESKDSLQAEPSLKKPIPGSFLELLWPVFEKTVINTETLPHTHTYKTTNPDNLLTRLIATWSFPIPIAPAPHILERNPLEKSLTSFTEWDRLNDSSIERNLGIAIHEALEQLARHPGLSQNLQQDNHWLRRLTELGIPSQQLPKQIEKVYQAIDNMLADPRGQWILAAHHEEAHCEYPLSAAMNNQIIHVIIDRTFVENDVRWIIDYKTSVPYPDEALADFIMREKGNYQQQLANYAQVMRLIEKRSIRLGLYFPLCPAWHEWVFEG